MTGLLFQAFVYLCAAVIAVPIAKRLGLGSVLGYLIAGIVIGPALGLVGDTESIQHIAEFGVVMMLFLVGLELEPRTLWTMRNRLLGLGGLQVGVTTVLVMAIDDMDRAVEIVKHARRERPDLHIVACARNRHYVYELYKAGADDIVRETFDSAVRAARYSLEAFGVHPHEVEKLITVFVDRDRDGIRRLARVYDPQVPPFENEPYMKLAREIEKETEEALSDNPSVHDRVKRAWLPPGSQPDEDKHS